jgi:hypothetical protein
VSLTARTESPAYNLEGPNGNVKGYLRNKSLDSQKKIRRERRGVAHNT